MNTKAFLFWTGVSLGMHLALFAVVPALRPPSASAVNVVPVHLVASRLAEPRRPSSPAVSPSVAPPTIAPRPTQKKVSDRATRPKRTPPAATAPAASPLSPPAPAPRVPEPLPEAAVATASMRTIATPHAAAAQEDEVKETPAGEPDNGSGETAILTETAAPLYERNPPPVYPRLAKARGWQGEVLLHVRVSAAGKVVTAMVEQSSGHAVLDQAALRAVQQWRFRPGEQGGIAVASEVLVPIRYRLEGG